MYERSAALYDKLYGFKDYDAAVATLVSILDETAPNARTLLEVACGTGLVLDRLAKRYEVEGLDVNEEMLAMARQRCPDVPLHREDMAAFDLSKQFDVIVCLFSSIAYVKTPDRLTSAIAAMRRHLSPGGVLVVEPFFTPENFWTHTITANHVDEDDLKITWMYTSEREGDVGVLEMQYLVGTPDGIDHFNERHELGLFTQAQIAAAFEAVGLRWSHQPGGPFGRGVYVACA